MTLPCLVWGYLKRFEMGRNAYFQFKQFKVVQEKAAMKVGTDGVLLGAWADVSGAKNILDIGTGTGVIALMLAQRSVAPVTGIEIEPVAAREAAENARQSPWKHRIVISNSSFQAFWETTPGSFDRIVTNPPFFTDNKRSRDHLLAMARHNDLLPFTDLACGAVQLLAPKGKLALILPVEPALEFIDRASGYSLHLNRLTEVKPGKMKIPNRYLMEFSKTVQPVQKNSISIHRNDGTDFTREYKALTRDFYLNF